MTTPTKVPLHKITKDHIGQVIQTFGWIQHTRTQGKTGTFIDLYFNFKTVKCLAKTQKNLTSHSSVSIIGEVKENYSKKDNAEFEIHVQELDVYQIAPSYPLNEESTQYKQLELGHLHLRSSERILFLKARNELQHLVRKFYYDNEYCEIVPPTLVQTQVEGGATLFHIKYYGEDAYLTQSSQLYLETVVPSTGKAYCIMPSYRAEKFNTSRHLSEYTHVEAEIGDICFDELMDEIEKLVKYVIGEFARKMGDEVIAKSVNKKQHPLANVEELLNEKFKKIKYGDAIQLLRDNNVMKDKENNGEYTYGDDISDRDEIKLVEIMGGKPVFLTDFPVEHKPFYCRKREEEQNSNEVDELSLDKMTLRKTTESCDLLWPGIGEILGGSMRAEKHQELMDGFIREGIDPKPYYWYTDLRLYGANRHGGYGLGFERFMRGLMDYENVNKACLYPRFPGRCQP